MLKLFVRLQFILLFSSQGFAYPGLLSKRCANCHTEASGSGILTPQGKDSSNNYFEITTPAWLLLGLKADIKQTFTETPYEKTGSFKATRVEPQLGLNQAVDTYLNVSAQGSLNRIEPKTKSDSISDYVYSPYRFIELKYSERGEENIAIKYGYYRNEWQSDLSAPETSYRQSELIYVHTKHQVSIGYINRIKTYNKSYDSNNGYLNYKFFLADSYSFLLGHQQGNHYQLTSLGLTAKKSEQLTFKTVLAQTVLSEIKGLKAMIMPLYQYNSYLKFYGFAEYQNTNIKMAKPRTIIYGLGADYLWFKQGLLSVIYSKSDDSMLINNPTQNLELNFHLYM